MVGEDDVKQDIFAVNPCCLSVSIWHWNSLIAVWKNGKAGELILGRRWIHPSLSPLLSRARARRCMDPYLPDDELNWPMKAGYPESIEADTADLPA